MGHVGVGIRDARERRVELRERPFGRRIDEQPQGQIQKLVAGRSFDRPVRRQCFVRSENLFDHDVTRAGLAETMQIVVGILHAVHVIDPQAVGNAGAHQLGHEPVGLPEHLRILDAQADQGVHVEEAPVSEVAIRRLPPR